MVLQGLGAPGPQGQTSQESHCETCLTVYRFHRAVLLLSKLDIHLSEEGFHHSLQNEQQPAVPLGLLWSRLLSHIMVYHAACSLGLYLMHLAKFYPHFHHMELLA